jgi:membrane-bound inhibitor of C-type lysozyme
VRRAIVRRAHLSRAEGLPEARSEDAKGASHGPFSIRCDGFDPVISIGYAGTDPSWAWAEWSGKGHLLAQALSGSGAKYDGPADGGTVSIWTKGMTQALVDLPGGKSFTACKVSGPR